MIGRFIMSKVIFFGFPAHGHTNPTLALVKELVSRGEEVIYYSFDEFKNKIEQTGATFKSYSIDVSNFKQSKKSSFPKLFKMIMEGTSIILGKLIIDIKNENPDYIIHDSFCPWGKYIAAILKIPAISSITIFVFSNKSLNISKLFVLFSQFFLFGLIDYLKGLAIQESITKKYRIKKPKLEDIFINKEKLNIVYTSKNFQPNGNKLDNSFKFVGPSIIERNEKNDSMLSELKALPLIYISLGTTIANSNINFYYLCFEALSDMKLQVILSVGNKIELSTFKNIPSNFIIRNYVPQLLILARSDCFITHGGMNSVHEGLYYGVPLIVVPQQKEQEAVAERVEATNAGIFLRKVNSKSIRESVISILNNKMYKMNSVTIGESLKSAGGYSKAVDEIIQFKNEVSNSHNPASAPASKQTCAR